MVSDAKVLVEDVYVKEKNEKVEEFVVVEEGRV